MVVPKKVLRAVFYSNAAGKEPVRDWLLKLDKQDRKLIGEDIGTLEFCWPIGKPKCSPMKGVRNLFEVRSTITGGRITRVLFLLLDSRMVLLHGFVKKTQKTPQKDLDLAVARMKEVLRHE